MAMLAERKRKTKWVINPTKKPIWTTDSDGIKFGKKLMEKMGWTAGKGLGAKEQGIQEPLKVSYKNDTKGMGFKGNEDDWVEYQDEFNTFLNQLRSSDNSTTAKSSEGEKTEIKSLEKKSKQSRSRVHYQKFTRGKDLSRYSENDLACILGLSKTNKRKNKPEEIVQADVKTNGAVETSFGVTTINSGSIADYFKKKPIYNKGKSDDAEDLSQSPSNEKPCFSEDNINLENEEIIHKEHNPKSGSESVYCRKRKKIEEVEVSWEEESKKKKNKKNYNEPYKTLQHQDEENIVAESLGCSSDVKKIDNCHLTKKRKEDKKNYDDLLNETSQSQNDINIVTECLSDEWNATKKRKKDKTQSETEAPDDNEESKFILKKKKKKKDKERCLEDNNSLNVPSTTEINDTLEVELAKKEEITESKKKKKKKKDKERCLEDNNSLNVPSTTEINDTLEVELAKKEEITENKKKKEKKKQKEKENKDVEERLNYDNVESNFSNKSKQLFPETLFTENSSIVANKTENILESDSSKKKEKKKRSKEHKEIKCENLCITEEKSFESQTENSIEVESVKKKKKVRDKVLETENKPEKFDVCRSERKMKESCLEIKENDSEKKTKEISIDVEEKNSEIENPKERTQEIMKANDFSRNNELNGVNVKAQDEIRTKLRNSFFNEKEVDKYAPGDRKDTRTISLIRFVNISEFKGSSLEQIVGYGRRKMYEKQFR